MHKIFHKIKHFITEDLWQDKIINQGVSKIQITFLKITRIFYVVVTGIYEDQCFLRASALAYTTVLSVVPLLAFAFSIVKAFGVTETIPSSLSEKLSGGQQEIVTYIIDYVQNTNFKALGAIGLLILLWTVIKLLSNIEISFNKIWGIKQHRTFFRKLADYMSMVFIIPFLVVVGMGITASISHTAIFQELMDTPFLSFLFVFISRSFSLLLIWAAFALMYIFMPNTKVKISSGFFAGVIAGSLWELFFYIYTEFQIGVAKYNAIYTGFSAFPIFLIWLYTSWLIVLIGAEFSFAFQNVSAFRDEKLSHSINFKTTEKLAKRIMLLLAIRFHRAENPLNAEEIAAHLGAPIKVIREILYDLVKAGYVTEGSHNDDIEFYQPARPLGSITIRNITDAVKSSGRNLSLNDDVEEVKYLEEFYSSNDLVSIINTTYEEIVKFSLKK